MYQANVSILHTAPRAIGTAVLSFSAASAHVIITQAKFDVVRGAKNTDFTYGYTASILTGGTISGGALVSPIIGKPEWPMTTAALRVAEAGLTITGGTELSAATFAVSGGGSKVSSWNNLFLDKRYIYPGESLVIRVAIRAAEAELGIYGYITWDEV